MKRKLLQTAFQPHKAMKVHDNAFLTLATHDGRISSTGLTLKDLGAVLCHRGLPGSTALRVFNAVYRRGISPWEHPKSPENEREVLMELLDVDLGERLGELESLDGTIKWLTKLRQGGSVESVLIPKNNVGIPRDGQYSLCVSSQVGCSLTCSFCHTGMQSKKGLRNLHPDEYISQIAQAHLILDRWPRNPAEKKQKKIKNIVFMGQGEPLMNYRSLTKAINILQHVRGLAYPWSSLTVSTSGIAPAIRKLTTDKVKVRLAVSLHSSCNELRTELVPINATYPIEEVLEAAKEYASWICPNKSNRHHFLGIQYTLLSGVNDALSQADDLAALLTSLDLNCHVNLIPFNEYPQARYSAPDMQTAEAFKERLMERNICTHLRARRGSDILAACGQLNSDYSTLLSKNLNDS